jgi:hypothetical protein
VDFVGGSGVFPGGISEFGKTVSSAISKAGKRKRAADVHLRELAGKIVGK